MLSIKSYDCRVNETWLFIRTKYPKCLLAKKKFVNKRTKQIRQLRWYLLCAYLVLLDRNLMKQWNVPEISNRAFTKPLRLLAVQRLPQQETRINSPLCLDGLVVHLHAYNMQSMSHVPRREWAPVFYPEVVWSGFSNGCQGNSRQCYYSSRENPNWCFIFYFIITFFVVSFLPFPFLIDFNKFADLWSMSYQSSRHSRP